MPCPIQRYDVRYASGHFVERYWQPVNTPIFDAKGRLVYLLHHVEEVQPSSSDSSKKTDKFKDSMKQLRLASR